MAGAASHGRGDAAGEAVRDWHRRDSPQSPHRLPGRLSETRHRRRPADVPDMLGRQLGERRAVRRAGSGLHAQSALRRHPDSGLADPGRHLDLRHHQRPDQPIAPRGRPTAGALVDRRPRAAIGRSGRAVQRSQRHDPAAGRHGFGAQGLRPVVAGGSPDRRPGGTGTRRPARGLGRDGVPADHRPRGVRRKRCVHPADRCDRAAVPCLAAGAGR